MPIMRAQQADVCLNKLFSLLSMVSAVLKTLAHRKYTSLLSVIDHLRPRILDFDYRTVVRDIKLLGLNNLKIYLTESQQN